MSTNTWHINQNKTNVEIVIQSQDAGSDSKNGTQIALWYYVYKGLVIHITYKQSRAGLLSLNELFHSIPGTKLSINQKKRENSRLLAKKNTKVITISFKGPKMAKDGEDWHGLQTTNLKNLGRTFQDAQTATELSYVIGLNRCGKRYWKALLKVS